MKLKFIEHLLSTLAVLALLIVLMFVNESKTQKAAEVPPNIKPYAEWTFTELNNPFEKALMSDLMNQYHPGQEDENHQTVQDLVDFKQNELIASLQGSHFKEGLNSKKLAALGWMYFKFLLVYIIVMGLTFYGVQTLAVWRYVREKRAYEESLTAKGRAPAALALKLLKKLAGAMGSMILFSPAYIIAYSMRTDFNTDMLIFVVLLATISNGLLAMYSTKFYTFLTSESRRGYVETAVVKNLNNRYLASAGDGIPNAAIFKLRKRFDTHVFGHIFKNAEFQYWATLKEQAAFLITGLIIIEMALNIHGHLSYEMLKQLLYKNYDIVMVILMAIFFTVKMTELFTDVMIYIRHKKFNNQNSQSNIHNPIHNTTPGVKS